MHGVMMAARKKPIILLVPYFGKAPLFWSSFYHSISHSKLIDVICITDCLSDFKCSDNIHIVQVNFDDFKNKVTGALGCQANISSPYKICDFKPAFAKIFQKEIEGYDFWAYGDIDTVFGDIDFFISDKLDKYDVISFRKHWLSGSLTIIRNQDTLNDLYMRSSMVAQVFAADSNHCFDEAPGDTLRKVLDFGEDYYELKSIDTFTGLVFRAARRGELRLYNNDLALEWIGPRTVTCLPSKVMCSNGKSYPYYHLVCDKGLKWFSWKGEVPFPVTFSRWGYCSGKKPIPTLRGIWYYAWSIALHFIRLNFAKGFKLIRIGQ